MSFGGAFFFLSVIWVVSWLLTCRRFRRVIDAEKKELEGKLRREMKMEERMAEVEKKVKAQTIEKDTKKGSGGGGGGGDGSEEVMISKATTQEGNGDGFGSEEIMFSKTTTQSVVARTKTR